MQVNEHAGLLIQAIQMKFLNPVRLEGADDPLEAKPLGDAQKGLGIVPAHQKIEIACSAQQPRQIQMRLPTAIANTLGCQPPREQHERVAFPLPAGRFALAGIFRARNDKREEQGY